MESGYIKLFETHITSSYAELGRPPREQTIEGQEPRNYTHSLQQNHFGIQKVEKTIHGNPPCIMLANSIRGEHDHRIKTEIIDRLEKTKQQLAIKQLDVVWVMVNLPNTNTKAAAKCITNPRESHTLIPQVIHAINTHQNKIDYPHTYNYNTTALIPPTTAIDHAIKRQAEFTRSLTSVLIIGLNKIDIYTTKLKETTTIVQQILNGTYTTPEGTRAQSPVTKISMSESKGRYNLFTNKNNAQALMEYTAHLLKVIPKWLDGNVNYTGGKILADTTAATQYARVQPKSNLMQPQPTLTAPEQTKPNPPATVSSSRAQH